MDLAETAVLRKAGLRKEMGMFSSVAAPATSGSGHWLSSQNASSWFLSPQTEEDFSVDDLLDLEEGKEQSSDIEAFLELEAEVEEEEQQRKESSADVDASSSVLSFHVLPPSETIVPQAGDVADLEWVSRFVDDSYSEFPAAAAPYTGHHSAAAPVPLAISKTEAPPPLAASPPKRAWGSCCFSTDAFVIPAKTRSKRSRSGGRVWSLSDPLLFSESSSSSCSSGSSSSSCSASSTISSCLSHAQPPFPEAMAVQFPAKKKGRKPKALVGGGTAEQTRRRCTHCGVDKTPQWRAGPMGAKTLCNACGVRYKSGRLLPEYRPAGSPTFIGHIHSNSHRKVLELRRKKETTTPLAACAATPAMLVASPQPYGVV